MSENLKHLMIAFPLTVVVIALTFLGYSGYNYSSLTETTKEVAGEVGEVKIGITNDILGLYPQTENETVTMGVNSSIYEGLSEFDGNFRVKPLLAKSWNNPDDNTWKIYLKKNVKFHNGETLKASDVKFTYDYLIENEFAPMDYLSAVDTVTVIDDETLEIKTKNPYPILMNKLANVLILSEKDITENGIKKPTGTGPYKLVEWEEETHIKLERNENYHGVLPNVKKVTYIPVEDDEERIAKLSSGELNLLDLYANKEALESLSTSSFETRSINEYGVRILMPNYTEGKIPGTDTDDNPFLNKKVRQAIYQGIDIDKLIEKTGKNNSSKASQISTAAIFGFNSNIKRYEHNQDKARSLLKEAGYENGFTTQITANPSGTPVVEELIVQLKEIGITVTADYLSSPRDAFEKFSTGNFSLVLLTWTNDSGDSSDAIDGVLSSEGSSNFFGYSNETIDNLATKASSTMNSKKRKGYLKDALKESHDDIALVPINIDKHFFAFTNDLLFTPRNDGQLIAKSISGKKTETISRPSFAKYLLDKLGL